VLIAMKKKGFSGIIKAAYLADLVLASFIFITAISVRGDLAGFAKFRG
jgi:hypothetical protein